MKKFFFLAAAVIAMGANCAMAEDDYGMQKSDISTEIQFNPFSNDFGTFKLDQIKVRYMFTDKDALRFGIGFGLDTNKNTPDPENNDDVWNKNTYGSFSINLGYERHLVQKGRIDLYAGLGLGFERTNASSTSQAKAQTGTTQEGDPIYEITETKYHNCWSDQSKRTANIFKVDIFTGIDFYVYKGLYVGAELGIRLNAKSCPGWYTTAPGTDNNGNYKKDLESAKADKQNEFSFKTYCEPALRLGWTF